MHCFYACHGCVMRSGPGRTRTYGVSLTVADLQSAPFAARGTDPINHEIERLWPPYVLVIKRMVAFGWSHQLAASSHPQYKCACSCIVGMAGFEPATPCSQSRCATKLRHIPCVRFTPTRPQMIPVFSVERKALGVNQMQYLMKRMILHHSATSCSQCIGSIHDWLKRGYVGDAVLLSIIVVELDQQKLTHKRPMAQLLVLGVLPRTRSPDHDVRRILLIREAGARS